MECTCKLKVQYSDLVVKDQVIAGIANTEIKEAVLSHAEVNDMTLDKLVVFVEGKEAGKASLGQMESGGAVNKTWTREPRNQRGGGGKPVGASNASGGSNKSGGDNNSGRESCRSCGRRHARGECRASKLDCHGCGKTGHIARLCPSKSSRETKSKPEAKQVHPTAKKVNTPEEDATESAQGVKETHWTCQVTQGARSWAEEVENVSTDDSDSVDVDTYS